MKFKAGIARNEFGEPMASLEVVTVINLASVDAPEGNNVTLRGLTPMGIEMRPDEALRAAGFKRASAKWWWASRSQSAFRAPRSASVCISAAATGMWWASCPPDRAPHNSEIFGDLNQVSADFQRVDVLSSALVRATDPGAAAALINSINDDQRLNMNAVSEKEYYELQTRSAAPIEYLGIFVSIIMAIGAASRP